MVQCHLFRTQKNSLERLHWTSYLSGEIVIYIFYLMLFNAGGPLAKKIRKKNPPKVIIQKYVSGPHYFYFLDKRLL